MLKIWVAWSIALCLSLFLLGSVAYKSVADDKTDEPKDTLPGTYWCMNEENEITGIVTVLALPKGYFVSWSFFPVLGEDSVSLKAACHGKGARFMDSLAVSWAQEKSTGVSAYFVGKTCVEGEGEHWVRAVLPKRGDV